MHRLKRTRRRRAMIIAAAVAGGVVNSFLTRDARAATIPWFNSSGGNFNTAANWNSGSGPVPGASDTAQFNIAATYLVNLDISPTNASLTVGGGTVTFTNTTVGRTYAGTGGRTNSAGNPAPHA